MKPNCLKLSQLVKSGTCQLSGVLAATAQFHIIPIKQVQHNSVRKHHVNPPLQWCIPLWPQINSTTYTGSQTYKWTCPTSSTASVKITPTSPWPTTLKAWTFTGKQSTALAITVYFSCITKLREHFTLFSHIQRPKKFTWGKKFRLGLLLYCKCYQNPFFSWNSKIYYILIIKMYIECSRTESIYSSNSPKSKLSLSIWEKQIYRD